MHLTEPARLGDLATWGLWERPFAVRPFAVQPCAALLLQSQRRKVLIQGWGACGEIDEQKRMWRLCDFIKKVLQPGGSAGMDVPPLGREAVGLL